MSLCCYHFSEQWLNFQSPALALVRLGAFSHSSDSLAALWLARHGRELSLRALASTIMDEWYQYYKNIPAPFPFNWDNSELCFLCQFPRFLQWESTLVFYCGSWLHSTSFNGWLPFLVTSSLSYWCFPLLPSSYPKPRARVCVWETQNKIHLPECIEKMLTPCTTQSMRLL